MGISSVFLLLFVAIIILMIVVVILNKKNKMYKRDLYDLENKIKSYKEIESLQEYKEKITKYIEEKIYKLEVKFS